jgi:hypothetical protein
MPHYRVVKKFRAALINPDNHGAESNLTDFGPADEIEIITDPRHGSSLGFQRDGLLFTQDRATLLALCSPVCDLNEQTGRDRPTAHSEGAKPPFPSVSVGGIKAQCR